MVAALARERRAHRERRKQRMLYRHLKVTSADKDTGFTRARPAVAGPFAGVNTGIFDGMRNGCSAGRGHCAVVVDRQVRLN